MRELGLFVDAGAGAASSGFDGGGGGDVGVGVNVDVDIGFPRFKSLTKLSVGVSDIKDENAVALFLSRLCPLDVEIECGVTWHADLEEWVAELQDEEDGMVANGLTPINTNNTATNNNVTDNNNVTTTTTTPPAPPSPSPAAAALNLTTQISTRCKKWEAVGRALPLLTRLRIEERERGRALEGEVEDLRVRNLVLMEMAWGKGKGAIEGGTGCVVG
jgi:hypothetical protein